MCPYFQGRPSCTSLLPQNSQMLFDSPHFGLKCMEIGFHLRYMLSLGPLMMHTPMSVLTPTSTVATAITLAFLAATSLTRLTSTLTAHSITPLFGRINDTLPI
jgi:hypothetical protein